MRCMQINNLFPLVFHEEILSFLFFRFRPELYILFFFLVQQMLFVPINYLLKQVEIETSEQTRDYLEEVFELNGLFIQLNTIRLIVDSTKEGFLNCIEFQ